eukprot:9455595-Ditylum_brightwellii.AAC.1
MGHFKAPGGNGTMQLNVLKKLAHEYTIKVMASALTNTEARMYFDSYYCKSIGYISGQSFFTEKEIQTLDQEA